MSVGTRMPAVAKASAIATDCPPEPPAMPTPSPVNGGSSVSTLRMSTSSTRLRAWIAPAWRQAASQTSDDPASEAVCERVARPPSSVRPPFQSTTGLWGVVSRSVRKKRGPSCSPSTYIARMSVLGSPAKYSR